MKHSPQLARLIEALRALPGVGPKTAQRMAFHLLQEGRPGARALAASLEAALAAVSRCRRCRMLTEGELCSICGAPQRDAALLCAVESPADVVAIESSGSYRGRYFVLMGHLSPLDGIGPEQLGVRELEAILAEGQVRELILATNSDGRRRGHGALPERARRAARRAREPHRARRAGGRGARVRRRRHARARARRPAVAELAAPRRTARGGQFLAQAPQAAVALVAARDARRRSRRRRAPHSPARACGCSR